MTQKPIQNLEVTTMGTKASAAISTNIIWVCRFMFVMCCAAQKGRWA